MHSISIVLSALISRE